MTIDLTTALQLFRVTVTQEWTAEVDALVWATSKQEAEKAAKLEVDLNPIDAEDGTTWTSGKEVPLETAQQLTPRQAADLWLIDPNGNTVELAEFLEVISPDQLEVMRLRQIEANNGQLALLEVAA